MRRKITTGKKVTFVASTLLVAVVFSGFSMWAQGQLDTLQFPVISLLNTWQFPIPWGHEFAYLEHIQDTASTRP